MWAGRKRRAAEKAAQDNAMLVARTEERILVLQTIKGIMLLEGEGALVEAGKRTIGELAERLCELWQMKDTAKLFAQWGVKAPANGGQE